MTTLDKFRDNADKSILSLQNQIGAIRERTGDLSGNPAWYSGNAPGTPLSPDAPLKAVAELVVKRANALQEQLAAVYERADRYYHAPSWYPISAEGAGDDLDNARDAVDHIIQSIQDQVNSLKASLNMGPTPPIPQDGGPKTAFTEVPVPAVRRNELPSGAVRDERSEENNPANPAFEHVANAEVAGR